MTVQGAVHNGHSLGAGDELLGAEGAVGVTVDEAHIAGRHDVLVVPGALFHIGEGVLDVLVGILEEAAGDGSELGTGDFAVGLKGAVVIAVDDACVGEGADGVVEPVVGHHIGVAAGLAPELGAGLVSQHTEEDGGHLSTGDVALGLHGHAGLVVGLLAGVVVHGIADDVAVVVLGVQNRGLGAASATATAGDRVGNGGLTEVLRQALVTVGIHGVEGSAVVGVQGGLPCAAILVVLAIGAGSGLGVGELHGVGQGDSLKVGDGHIDIPDEALCGVSILPVCIVVKYEGIAAGIGAAAFTKAITRGFVYVSKTKVGIGQINNIQLLAANGQRQVFSFIHKVKIIVVALVVFVVADHVCDLGAGGKEIMDVFLDVFKRHIFSISKIVHKRGAKGECCNICFYTRYYDIIVVFRCNPLINFIRLIQSDINSGSILIFFAVSNKRIV